ncbi:hypothetical protein ABS71_16095 [bacterium SCN 62-11]|nr:MAG: hypothetical protein ABS71_16095 [bacterium SCN 62-11]
MNIGEALELFQTQSPSLELACLQLKERLQEALQEANIQFHSISSRLKSPESLRPKLARPDKTYANIWEVTDLVGLRVTTYFEDTIDDVARIIESRFAVDFGHTQDRLAAQDYRVFGYRSLHYVCGLEQTRTLPPGFRFEIQIRTILQHAWAEIEHDLGYKASDSTPDTIRRRFIRIAGLLELADEEFVSIRRDLRAYEKSVRACAQDSSADFPLDRLSLQGLVQASAVQEMDRKISQLLQRPLSTAVFFPEYLLKMLRLSGFRETREVYAALEQHGQHLLTLIAPYFEFTRTVWRLNSSDFESIPQGYSLFFLSHSVILQSSILERNKVAKLAQFYKELDYPDDEKSAQEVAEKLLETLARSDWASASLSGGKEKA